MAAAENMGLMRLATKEQLSAAFTNISKIRRIAFDLGQYIVKVVYVSELPVYHTSEQKTVSIKDATSLHLYCVQMGMEDFEGALDYIIENGELLTTSATITSTFKTPDLEDLIKSKLKLELVRIPQMDCLVLGTNFLIRNIEAESFTYDHHNDLCKYSFETFRPSTICPYLLMNVGTGISVYRVDSDEKYERVGGSTVGGGSFFGLAHLLTGMENDLDELMLMAEEGDHRNIDKLVEDTYGSSYDSVGLRGDIIAGSFAKCARREDADKIKKNATYRQDVVRSLLLMVSNDVGQRAVLFARKENVDRIYFDGFFIRNHPIIMRTLSYSVKFWSQGRLQALFLRHEGYTPVIGAFLKGGPSLSRDSTGKMGELGERLSSWHEYYTGCSELGRFVPTAPLSAGFAVGVLELERAQCSLRPFPLLADDITEYKPDVVDLSISAEDREFWIKIMEDSIPSVIKKAIESQRNTPDVEDRAQQFKEKFQAVLSVIREKSFAYGHCSVRNLLDLREQILNQHGFDDSYLSQKTLENNCALLELPQVLEKIDKVQDEEARLLLVSRGLLAGNVFDWGAKKVVELMESGKGLSFDDALALVPERPWLIDGYKGFSASLLNNDYHCAAIFVDNSGFDYVLGVIPFARELYRHGLKVIIVANLNPALNDLTYREMLGMVDRLKAADSVLKEAIETDFILFHHSGQSSPCLDLRRVNHDLNKAVIEHNVDLVVVEGMGRAVHTNLDAKFICDSLKVAVVKTQWLANLLNGELFSVVFKHERGNGNVISYDSE